MDYTQLTLAGINISELLSRLMNNEHLLGILVRKFVADGSYAELLRAIDAHDQDAAARATHTLKGMCGNMSLHPLFELFEEQMRLWRADDWNGAVALMPRITPTFETAIAHMELWTHKNA